jgi:hypothetical protein
LDEVDPWQRTLCRISDEVALQAKATPQSVQALVAHYGSHNAACRALFIMAWFNMLTRFVDSTGVPLETGEEPHALTAAMAQWRDEDRTAERPAAATARAPSHPPSQNRPDLRGVLP